MTKSTSLDQLRELLVKNKIDISEWGNGTIKSLENLWEEIQKGDCTLETDPFCRAITVVQILIRQNGFILIEKEQEMANGTIRDRNRPLAEKMQPGESVTTAALRGIEEELGIMADQVIIQKIIEQTHTDQEFSPSYPGLLTRYTFYTVEADGNGLPITDFTTEEISPNDPVRKHFWTWMPEEEALHLF